MKINQIVQETTTAGSVAPVEQGFVKMQTRSPSVYGNTKAGNLLKGKKTSKPFANSVNESAELSEADLQEDDIIVLPGQGRKLKTGFVPHGKSRVDHEVEMARSDVLATMKNARVIYELLKNKSEEEGLEGWVQEKLIKANDYLNSVKEYYDEKMMQQESVPPAGVIGNGGMGESRTEVKDKSGKVVSWKDDTEWHKAEKNKQGQPKDPRGIVTHLSDVARRKTASQQGLAEGGQVHGQPQWQLPVKPEVQPYSPGKPMPQSLQQKLDGKPNTGRAVDDKGRTQQQWMKLVKAKFPDAKIMQSKMPEGPVFAMLSDGRKLSWNKVEQSVSEGKIDFAKKLGKNIDKSNKAVVKTKKEVGSRVADIGAGGKEYNVKTDKAWDDAQKTKKAK